jgi:hypothetical protein
MDAVACLRIPVRRRIVIVCAILLSGCAANPYSTVKSVEPDPAPGTYRAVDLPAAMSKLSEYREDYRAKRSAEFDRQQTMSGSLFGLGALALAFGAYGAHRDAITGVAIAGATTYQAGMWNTTPGRNAIYSAGIQALDCGAAIMAPAMAALDRYDAVQAARTTLAQKKGTLLTAQAKLKAVTVTAQLTNPTRKRYQSLVDYATVELARAQATANKGSDWSTLVKRGGRDLWDYTRAVNEEVENALSKTVADPNTILDKVKGLDGYLPLFSGLGAAGGKFLVANQADGTRSTTQSGSSTEPGATEVDAVMTAQAELTQATDNLDTLLDGASLGNPGTALAGCRVDIAKAAPAIEVDPAYIELTAGAPFEQGFTVRHNAGRYNVFLKSVKANGVTVNQSMGNTFTVVVGPKSEAGTYLIDVIDNNNATAAVTVKLDPPAAAAATAAGNNVSGGAKRNIVCASGRTKAEICLLQQQLKVAMDGDAGDNTCRALDQQTGKKVFDGPTRKMVMAQVGLAETAGDAEISAKLSKACPASPQPAATPAPAAPAPAAPAAAAAAAPGQPPSCKLAQMPQNCAVPKSVCIDECRLTPAIVGKMRVGLGLSEAPQSFDDALRAKLKDKQKALGQPQTGYFTDDMKPALGIQ